MDFRARAEQVIARDPRLDGSLLPVVEKELLHYDILQALRFSGHLGKMTFQGGTALRLCYGSLRYSEDLDFVAGRGFSSEAFQGTASTIERRIAEKQDVEVRVTEPGERSAEEVVPVDKWQIRVVTAPDRPDIPKQRINLEIACVPAHTQEARTLRRNYDILPDGYEDLYVNVETLEEILADKLKALTVTSRTHVRYRDLWDIPWLMQQGATPSVELVEKKVADYGVEGFEEQLVYTLAHIPEWVHGEFASRMERFIQPSVAAQTLHAPGFRESLITDVSRALEAIQRGMEPDSAPLFPMG